MRSGLIICMSNVKCNNFKLNKFVDTMGHKFVCPTDLPLQQVAKTVAFVRRKTIYLYCFLSVIFMAQPFSPISVKNATASWTDRKVKN